MASQDWFDKDFYKVLGVSKDVTPAELKKAYRKLARQHHPDSNQGDAASEAKFKEISEAHSVLSDPEQRKEYDAVRAMGGGARFTAPGTGGQQGGFDDVFGGMFGGGGGQQNYSSSRAGTTTFSAGCSAEVRVVRAAGSVSQPADIGEPAGRPVAAMSRHRRPSTSSPRCTATRSPCKRRTAARSR